MIIFLLRRFATMVVTVVSVTAVPVRRMTNGREPGPSSR